MDNSAAHGGGISTDQSTLNITGKTVFRKNNFEYCGGSIYALKATVNIVGCRMDGKFRKYYGDCNSCTALFMYNSAQFFGGAVCTLDSTLTFERCNIISGNSAQYYGGGVHSQNCTLKFS